MRNFDICADAQDSDVGSAEISDAALELAAGLVRDGTANMTIAFCSGLDECSHPVPRRRRREIGTQLAE
jgi:hypothetical protein